MMRVSGKGSKPGLEPTVNSKCSKMTKVRFGQAGVPSVLVRCEHLPVSPKIAKSGIEREPEGDADERRSSLGL